MSLFLVVLMVLPILIPHFPGDVGKSDGDEIPQNLIRPAVFLSFSVAPIEKDDISHIFPGKIILL